MYLSYSLHKVVDHFIYPFSPLAYSQFKFGDTSVAKKFANELFNGFIEEYKELILSKEEIVIMPSPYYAVPTASNFLCESFKIALNRFLFENQREACKEGKIHRVQTYIEDYGSMDYEQRLNLISNDSYYLDREFVNNKFCIFLDDIKITGSHERTVTRILKEHNVQGQFMFLYYAELANSQIHPSIENHYNYFDVKSVNDVIRIILSDEFRFNTRIIKYILILGSEEFQQILDCISVEKKSELLDLAISNNYHKIKAYQNNIIKLNQEKLWQLTFKKDKGKQSTHPNLQLV